MRIRVPASSANLGPGFDSCGIAVSYYLQLEIGEEQANWEIIHQLGDEIPADEENMLVKTALRLAPSLVPRKIKMTTEIPVARGLGSSSSVIVAGIELANRLGSLGLTLEDKLKIATEIEGHPDNVAPAMCGGFVTASFYQNELHYEKHYFPECDLVAVIPHEEFLTSESRGLLPQEIPFSKAVAQSAIANVMVAAIVKGDLDVAGKMMEKDLFHEPYRAGKVPCLREVREIAHGAQAYGTFLSGAGPTVLTLIAPERTEKFIKALGALGEGYTIDSLHVDTDGVQFF